MSQLTSAQIIENAKATQSNPFYDASMLNSEEGIKLATRLQDETRVIYSALTEMYYRRAVRALGDYNLYILLCKALKDAVSNGFYIDGRGETKPTYYPVWERSLVLRHLMTQSSLDMLECLELAKAYDARKSYRKNDSGSAQERREFEGERQQTNYAPRDNEAGEAAAIDNQIVRLQQRKAAM